MLMYYHIQLYITAYNLINIAFIKKFICNTQLYTVIFQICIIIYNGIQFCTQYVDRKMLALSSCTWF